MNRGYFALRPLPVDRHRAYAQGMLHEFLSHHREAILERARTRIAAQRAPPTTPDDVAGIPVFLDQLTERLRTPRRDDEAVAKSAAARGAVLLKQGFTIAQVVHDYGGVCQAVTELADEIHAPITADEFRVFNACLDDAIAEAVTEFTRGHQDALREQQREEQREQHAELAHELRNAVGAALVSFHVLRMGKVGLEGSTAAVLGRSLQRLAGLVDTTLSEVRLEAGHLSPEPLAVRGLLEESAASASMEATARALSFHVTPGAGDVQVRADRALLAACVGNLLQNAFKFTRAGGHVWLTTSATDERVLIEVEDECGGLPPGAADELFKPFAQRGPDRSGLGLGLSIARRSVEASGGALRVKDVPGKGCAFTIDLPRLRAKA